MKRIARKLTQSERTQRAYTLITDPGYAPYYWGPARKRWADAYRDARMTTKYEQRR